MGLFEPPFQGHEKIKALLQKGVQIPHPWSVVVGDEVSVDRIAARGVVIHPGCRIYGRKTLIAPGAQLGYEGPVTLEDCWVGPGVELRGGFFRRSVFLEGASMGYGAHVREGCLLEEGARGAHCVGLKQTILFPFVTLGSLINFCDALVAGGTGPKDHTEIGSAYVHFNFTPEGNKATASMVGDVPRGVMLRERPIFLGGQGGMVGPLRIGYGNVVAAGSIIRRDCTEEGRLIVPKAPRPLHIPYSPGRRAGTAGILAKNLLFLGNLGALRVWYEKVRRPFFQEEAWGPRLLEGALEMLDLAVGERLRRLGEILETRDAVLPALEELFRNPDPGGKAPQEGRRFLEAVEKEADKGRYLDCIRGLPSSVSRQGTLWLEGIVSGLSESAASLFPDLPLFARDPQGN